MVIQKAFDELGSEMCHRGNDRICSTRWIMPLLYQFIHQPINQIIMAALITVSKLQLNISPYQPFINSECLTLREGLKCFFASESSQKEQPIAIFTKQTPLFFIINLLSVMARSPKPRGPAQPFVFPDFLP